MVEKGHRVRRVEPRTPAPDPLAAGRVAGEGPPLLPEPEDL